jgi:pantoate--beta-alanine ligase
VSAFDYNKTQTFMMITHKTIKAIRTQITKWKSSGLSVAFVPTMGNLHAGHLSLLEQARSKVDKVIISIFVNPLQFNESTDFDTYPRTIDEDISKLEKAGADALFLPSADEIYPNSQNLSTKVIVPGLSEILEGESRPGHFTGVTTVVNKLFNMVMPDIAFFGEKDFQQLMLIRHMVKDLNMPIAIEAVATLREGDGLAMSSRNSRISEQQRPIANTLFLALNQVKQALQQGQRNYPQLEASAIEFIRQKGLETEYIAIRKPVDLSNPIGNTSSFIILGAVRLDQTRLIDNISL